MAKGQAVPSGRRPRLGKAGLWRIDGTWWTRVTGYTVLFLKGGPAECQWSAGGTEQGCLPSCLRTRHGAWTCARGGGVGVWAEQNRIVAPSLPLPVVPRSVVQCHFARGLEEVKHLEQGLGQIPALIQSNQTLSPTPRSYRLFLP